MQMAQTEFDLDIIITAEIKDGQIVSGQQLIFGIKANRCRLVEKITELPALLCEPHVNIAQYYIQYTERNFCTKPSNFIFVYFIGFIARILTG